MDPNFLTQLAGLLGMSLTAYGGSALLRRLMAAQRQRNPVQTYFLQDGSGSRLRVDLDDRHTPRQRQAAIERAARALARQSARNERLQSPR